MNRSFDVELRAEDASDAKPFTTKSTRDLSHADRLILQRAISWAMGRMEFHAKYDNMGDVKHAVATQLEKIGFKMPKVNYRPSFARNYVKFNVRRRLLAQGVQVSQNFGGKSILPADGGATDPETVSPLPTQSRRESFSSDFVIYPPDEPEAVCSDFTPPPPPPPNELEPVRSDPTRSDPTPPPPPPPIEPEPMPSEVASQFVSKRQKRVSFSFNKRTRVPPTTCNPPPPPDMVERVGSGSTPGLALPEAEAQDDEEDVYSMCKRTLSRLFTTQAGNAVVCPLCDRICARSLQI